MCIRDSVSPAWYQLRGWPAQDSGNPPGGDASNEAPPSEDIVFSLTGGHDFDEAWVRDVRDGVQGKRGKGRRGAEEDGCGGRGVTKVCAKQSTSPPFLVLVLQSSGWIGTNSLTFSRPQIGCLRIVWSGSVSRRLFPILNQSQPAKKDWLWEKVGAQMPLLTYVFLGLGWPSVGEFVGFIIMLICSPTQQKLVRSILQTPTRILSTSSPLAGVRFS